LEFKKLLCGNFINILSDEKTEEYAHGQITEDFLKSNITDFDKQFYVCGPPAMMVAIEEQLSNLGIEKKAITVEEI
jgi:ferredoxin-NADP reductase